MSRKGEPTMAERATLLVRLWLPDRPGVLGAVASRIGAVGGDVHELEVVDRGEGRAVDELVVTVPRDCPLDLLSREIDEIDGVDIEEFEPVPRLPLDPRMQAFSAALDLAAAPDRPALARALADHARSELRADHVAVVDGPGGEVVARAGDGPAVSWLVALCRGESEPAGPLDGAQPRADDVGRTVVPGSRWTLVTGRSAITLRARERQVLQALADLTGLLLPSVGTP